MRFIYIVDDDRIAREIIQLSLVRDNNTLVRSFDNGVDFVAEADELDPGVLLLDLNMPNFSGAEVLETLRERGDDKFVTLLVTATNSVPLTVHAMKSGAVDVIVKPIERETLATTLPVAFERLEANLAAAAATGAARQRIEALSPRERTVLQHMYEGCSNKVTAMDLGISPRTVEIYRAALMRKLGVSDLAHAVRLVIEANWVPMRKNDAKASMRASQG